MDHLVDCLGTGEAVALDTGVERLWKACADDLRGQVSEATWKTWFEQMRPVAHGADGLSLTVPSSLVKERIEARYFSMVEASVASVVSGPCPITIEVCTEDAGERQLGGRSDPASHADGVRRPRQADTPLNPAYTFEAFVTGESNTFAHAAALAVAEKPARSYNPLFIYGAAGLGKTHLLHAIGHYVHHNYSHLSVKYVSTETFTNDFIDGIRSNATLAFKRRYRDADVLLVDDIQFLANKEGTQEEFFHTFNSLHGANRQIVMTSDRPPKSIATLEDRLRSRFEGGLITDVVPPDLETRIAILRRKAEGDQAAVSDPVLEFIATQITDNIRELEGALIRVTAFASLTNQPLTSDLAEHVLAAILSPNGAHQITPRLILDTTAETFGFTVEDLIGKSRRRPLVTARQVGMYVFRELTEFSFPAIGREFGDRDHTTVIHAVDKISKLMKERRTIYEQVTALITRIKHGG